MEAFSPLQTALLLAAIFGVAFFYSSVGHGGATGYLAALALAGLAPDSARVAVLIANVCVAGIALWQFWRAGRCDWKILFWLVLASVPCAYLGGLRKLAPHSYALILGVVLTIAGLILLFRSRWQTDEVTLRKFFWPLAPLIGAPLGFLAGLTGIGGGVFLSPVLYLLRWVKPKNTGSIAAGFIVLNSLAGLAGAGWEKVSHVGALLWLTLPAVIGALLGTHFGARRWSSVTFSRVLAAVLVFAGGKLLLEATN